MARKTPGRRRRSGLDYGTLEARQVLTTIVDLPYFPITKVAANYHIPVNEPQIVLTNLDEAPEIKTKPENGALSYLESAKTLVYTPNEGFTGVDIFEIGYGADAHSYNINVWESAYATPDWQLVQPGQSTTVDVLSNDYAFARPEYSTGYIDRAHWANRFSWTQGSLEFTIVGVSSPESGTLTIAEDGRSLVFESTDGFRGEQEVTYTIEDERGFQTSGSLILHVSDQPADGRYYLSESQWQQEQVEEWLSANARSMNYSWVYPTTTFEIDGSTWFPQSREMTFLATNGFADERLASSVVDVQEGDIVKSAGDLLFYVTHDTDYAGEFLSYLSIVDVSDPESPTLLSTTGYENRIEDIFLDEGRVAVVSSAQNRWGMSRHWGSSSNRLQLSVLDVTSPVVPSEVYSASIHGNYTDARLVGDRLYLISQGGQFQAKSLWELRESVSNPVSPADYVEALLNDENGFGLPEVTVDVDGELTTTKLELDEFVRRGEGSSGTLITTFDLQQASGVPVDMDLVQSQYIETVYVSSESIFLFGSGSVIKMSFDANAEVDFAADGELEGSLLNQFAASEHDGMLRVALNNWQNQSSDILVFEQTEDRLNVIGALEDIAPGERIFSTTFVEDQLFVVTFRQVDPLFVIDLGNASSPEILGELKIPGVSHYLQLIEDDILLAVGRDANEVSGWQTSLQVSLFDVSNPEDPQLLDRYSFEGGRSTDTPLFGFFGGSTDHHSLTFDQESGTLALPISRYGDGETSSGISLFEISRADGIEVIGDVEFDSTALRTVISGDRVVYFSEDSIKTASLDSPTVVLADLELPPEESSARQAGDAHRVCLAEEAVDSEEDSTSAEEAVSGEIIVVAEIDRVFATQPELVPDSAWRIQGVAPLQLAQAVSTALPDFAGQNVGRSTMSQMISAIDFGTGTTEPAQEIALNEVNTSHSNVGMMDWQMEASEWTFDEAFDDSIKVPLPSGLGELVEAGAEFDWLMEPLNRDPVDELTA